MAFRPGLTGVTCPSVTSSVVIGRASGEISRAMVPCWQATSRWRCKRSKVWFLVFPAWTQGRYQTLRTDLATTGCQEMLLQSLSSAATLHWRHGCHDCATTPPIQRPFSATGLFKAVYGWEASRRSGDCAFASNQSARGQTASFRPNLWQTSLSLCFVPQSRCWQWKLPKMNDADT